MSVGKWNYKTKVYDKYNPPLKAVTYADDLDNALIRPGRFDRQVVVGAPDMLGREAILKVQQANADGIRFLKEAGADQAVLTMKSLEAFEKAADGKATKIIIPSEIQGLAGLATALTESVSDPK